MHFQKTITLKTYLPGMTLNCYLYFCPDTKKGIVIDPGDGAQDIMAWAEAKGVKLERIVLTHGHIDHIGAVQELTTAYGLPVSIHKDDVSMLATPSLNLSTFSATPLRLSTDTIDILNDGDIISVGSLSAEVLHTPGHTPGGICLKTADGVFTGDTLFKYSVGRTDFPGGNMRDLISSIQTRLMVLPDSTAVFPGHEDVTTIGNERAFNTMIG